MTNDSFEIDFDPAGGPYSTLYVTPGKMYLQSPNGPVGIDVPDSLYQELRELYDKRKAT